jgi:hypothetical protein
LSAITVSAGAAAATVVGALVVRWSLDGLVASPDRYGEAWDSSVLFGPDELKAGASGWPPSRASATSPSAARARSNLRARGGETVQVATTGIARLAGPVPLTLLAGRAPAGPRAGCRHQDGARPRFARRDRTTASGPCGATETEVIGEVIVPNVGNNYPEDGSIVTLDAFQELCAADVASGFDIHGDALVRLHDSGDATSVRDD